MTQNFREKSKKIGSVKAFENKNMNFNAHETVPLNKCIIFMMEPISLVEMNIYIVKDSIG